MRYQALCKINFHGESRSPKEPGFADRISQGLGI